LNYKQIIIHICPRLVYTATDITGITWLQENRQNTTQLCKNLWYCIPWMFNNCNTHTR